MFRSQKRGLFFSTPRKDQKPKQVSGNCSQGGWGKAPGRTPYTDSCQTQGSLLSASDMFGQGLGQCTPCQAVDAFSAGKLLLASLATQGQISSALVFEKGVLSKISWGTLLYLGSSPLSFLRAHHVTIRTYQGHIPLLLRTNHKGINQGTGRSHYWDTV